MASILNAALSREFGFPVRVVRTDGSYHGVSFLCFAPEHESFYWYHYAS